MNIEEARQHGFALQVKSEIRFYGIFLFEPRHGNDFAAFDDHAGSLLEETTVDDIDKSGIGQRHQGVYSNLVIVNKVHFSILWGSESGLYCDLISFHCSVLFFLNLIGSFHTSGVSL